MLRRSAALREPAGNMTVTLAEILAALEVAAVAAFLNGSHMLSRRDLEQAASMEISAAVDVIDVLARQSGLLTQVSERGWTFVHKTFFEYFVGRAVAARRIEVAAVLHEDVIVAFAAGLLADPAPLLERVMEDRGLRVLRACLREVTQGATKASAVLVEKIVEVAGDRYSSDLLSALQRRPGAKSQEKPSDLRERWKEVVNSAGLGSHQRGRRLELFAVEFFGTLFRVVSHGVDTDLGQVDLLIENVMAGPFWSELGGDIPVECKNRQDRCGVSDVNTFLAKVGPRLRLGFILSSSGFTVDAQTRLRLAVMDQGSLVVPISGDDVSRFVYDAPEPEEFFKRIIRRMRNLESF